MKPLYKFHRMTQNFGNNQTFVILEVLESPKIACAVAYTSEPSPENFTENKST